MVHFNCDYLEGAHPSILKMLMETNMTQTVGYGEDEFCTKAKEKIKKACKRNDIDIHFLVGGTQTNFTFISSALRPYQGVISPATGHINVHETGAVEATGHKVLALSCGGDGKLTADMVEETYLTHINDDTHEHIVMPKMVYISNSTENGCVYTKEELTAISKVCKKHNLFLFLDGARLGYAMASPKNDLTLKDLCKLCDAFYIGGTKVGALFGEALVITNASLKEDFRYMIKQKGAMLAKGRLLGIQFLCLFSDNLYFDISKSAVDKAFKIADELKALGVQFLAQPESNQIFPILSNDVYKKLSEKYVFAFWEKYDDTSAAIRICTSWATTDENVDMLIADLKKIISNPNEMFLEKPLTEKKLKEIMDKESDNAKILLEDTDKLEHFLEKLEQKLKKVPLAGTHLSYIPVFVSLIKSYIKKEYTEIPTGSIIAIVACLIYFVSPIDLIPDTIPGVGYADDAALIAFALSMVESDIEDYKEWKKSL